MNLVLSALISLVLGTGLQTNINGEAQAFTNTSTNTQTHEDVQGEVVLDVQLPQLSLDVSGETEVASDTFLSIGL